MARSPVAPNRTSTPAPKEPSPKPGPKVSPKTAEDDLTPELAPENIDTPAEPITPENAIEARRQMRRLQARSRVIALQARRTLEEMIKEIPQEEQIEALESLVRLRDLVKAEGLSPGVLAFADPHGYLSQEIGGLESFGPGENWAMEGFMDTVKKVIARIGDFITGRMKPIGEDNIRRLNSIIDRAQMTLTSDEAWISRELSRTGFSDDAMRFRFPVEYYGRLCTAAGMNSIIDSLQDVPVAMRNLIEVEIPVGTNTATLSEVLNAALPAQLRRYWEVSITSGGLYYNGWNPPAFAGVTASRSDPMLFELGFQHPMVVTKIMERCVDLLKTVESVVPLLRERLAELNRQRDGLPPENDADIRNLQYCTALMFVCIVECVNMTIDGLFQTVQDLYTIVDAVFAY